MEYSQIILNIIITSCIYCILSLSFYVIYNVAKFFNISHAAIITFSIYFAFLFFKQMDIMIWLALPIAIILAILLSLLLEIAIFKPIRKKSTSPLVLLIASLGLYVILQNIISLIWGNETKSIRIGTVKVGNEILGAYITDIQIILIAFCALLYLSTIIFLDKTNFGRQIRAVSSNEELANIFGISSNKIILWAFVIGSGLGSVAGILVAFDTDITPTMGFNLLLYGVVVMIIGGVGSIWGLVGGAFLLATAQHLGAYYIDSKWMDAIAYVILILFLIWRPLGFSGKKLKKIEI